MKAVDPAALVSVPHEGVCAGKRVYAAWSLIWHGQVSLKPEESKGEVTYVCSVDTLAVPSTSIYGVLGLTSTGTQAQRMLLSLKAKAI